MIDGSRTGFAVGSISGSNGELSAVYKTTNGGISWDLLNFPYFQSTALDAVAFPDSSNGWVAGSHGQIYRTLDGGKTWTWQNSGTIRTISSLCFINADEGWATGGWGDGYQYLVLKTVDGGASWQHLSFGNTAFSCADIFFTDSNNGWLCGQDNQILPQIHHTSDGGATWTRQDLPFNGENGEVTRVRFADALEGWASVSSLYITPAGPVLHTTDGGNTWEVQFSTALHYNHLDVQDQNRIAVAAVQILYPSAEKVFVSLDGGESWSSSTPPVRNYTEGIDYAGDSVWIASTGSGILLSPDNGESWQWQNRSPYLYSMCWSDDSTGWAVAGTSVHTDNFCYKSTDGGDTWLEDPGAPGGAVVKFIDSQHGWMLREGNYTSIFRTSDGGQNWDQHNIPGSAWIGGMCFASPDSGWVYGSNGAVRFSSDGGQTWTTQTTGTTNYVQAMTFFNTLEGWAGGGYGGGNGFLIRTADGGKTWVSQPTSFSDHVLDLFFLTRQIGWVSTVSGMIYKTVNGGVTWSFLAQVACDYAEHIMFTNTLDGWVTCRNGGSDGRGFIYRTADGGLNWTLEWESFWPQHGIAGMALQDDNILWACGNHNTILKYSGFVGTGDDIPRSGNIGINMFPNPACREVNISINLPDEGYLKVEIFDLNGKKAAELFSSFATAGEHTISWTPVGPDGQGAPAGIYILQLKFRGNILSRKLVLNNL